MSSTSATMRTDAQRLAMPVIEPEDLICLTEIAELLDVRPSAVTNWRNRNVAFPSPWGEWKNGPLFLRDEIEVWYAERQGAKEAARQRQIEHHERALARLRHG